MAMEAFGRMGWGIQVGGRGGVCKVQVLGGAYNTRKMSRACISEEEEARGVVLACKLFPESGLRVKVLGKMVGALQAPDRTVEIFCGQLHGQPLSRYPHGYPTMVARSPHIASSVSIVAD